MKSACTVLFYSQQSYSNFALVLSYVERMNLLSTLLLVEITMAPFCNMD